MLTWFKHNAPVIGALAGALLAFAAVLQLVVVGPMNNRFDAQDKRLDDLRAEMTSRFDQQDKYISVRFDAVNQRFDDMDRSINQRVSRNEGRIDLLTEQLQTIDAPAP